MYTFFNFPRPRSFSSPRLNPTGGGTRFRGKLRRAQVVAGDCNYRGIADTAALRLTAGRFSLIRH